jgi:hypothetical protein
LCNIVLARRRSLGAALRYLASCDSHDRGDPLLALARGARVEIGWVVEMTSGAGQSVRRGFAHNRGGPVGQGCGIEAAGIISAHDRVLWTRSNRCVLGPCCFHPCISGKSSLSVGRL